MRDIFEIFTDLIRDIITQDVVFIFGALTGIPAFFSMIALYITFLRVHFAMKRDGKEPPGLGPIWLIELATAFMVTQSQYNKTIKHQAEHSVDLVPYALIQPYIKPMDRFFARGWLLSAALLCVCIPFAYWLYPEIFN